METFVNKNAVSNLCTFLHTAERDADNKDSNWKKITKFSIPIKCNTKTFGNKIFTYL